jgi:hypothetical protein
MAIRRHSLQRRAAPVIGGGAPARFTRAGRGGWDSPPERLRWILIVPWRRRLALGEAPGGRRRGGGGPVARPAAAAAQMAPGRSLSRGLDLARLEQLADRIATGIDADPRSREPKTENRAQAAPSASRTEPSARRAAPRARRARVAPRRGRAEQRQATSARRQAPGGKRQAPSGKRQAPRDKRQAPSAKRQAPSAKRQAPRDKEPSHARPGAG